MSAFKNHLQLGWNVLTEVPGWPDAPARARFARSLSIVLPTLGALAILGWQFAFYSPRLESQRVQMQPLVELDREVSSLRATGSERQLADVKARAAAGARLLLETAEELPAVLKELKLDAKERGWDATFQASDVSEDRTPDEAQIVYLPVRGKFKPEASNRDPFTSFLAVLEHLSATNKRIELTRVAIRADESRWQAVEVGLRLACAAPHAKTVK